VGKAGPVIEDTMYMDPLRYHHWRITDEAAWSLFDEWIQLMIGDLHHVYAVRLGEGHMEVTYYVRDRDGNIVCDWERNPVRSTRKVPLHRPPPTWPGIDAAGRSAGSLGDA
jgi:hypothetical protein